MATKERASAGRRKPKAGKQAPPADKAPADKALAQDPPSAKTDGADGEGPDRRARGREAAAGLDAMLTEAARGPVRSLFPGTSGVKFAAKLAIRPDVTVRRSVELGAELTRIALGRSSLEPPKRDRRFKDPAWSGNPGLKRMVQTYLAVGRTTDKLICDADLDWRSERRVRFAAENVLDALSPSNAPLINPEALKAALDTGGRNYVRGLRNLARDMRRPPRVPSMVDTSAFEVGKNIAVSPGHVVLRTPVFELIQYDPSTPTVREQPMLISPPMINKFYVTDIAPGRSMIEHLVSSGQQVFAISWRNPDERHADWGLDTYVKAVVDALDGVRRVTGADKAHVLGLCAGGIVASCTLAHLAAKGELEDRVAGLTLGVCVLDNEQAGTTSAFVDPATARMAMADSARRGYLDGRSLAGVFAWLRPNDLVWNYWVNNYLLGKDPPPFDVLFWNADTTNMPAALHRDFVNIAMHNALVYPGEVEVLGTPVDLSSITVDSYLVAGIADHITPWTNCYRSVHLLGSDSRFVLSTSGHIAALVNPPGNEKASYQVNDRHPRDPDAWLAGAATHRGSWWTDWAQWLGERSGAERDAPAAPGGDGLKPIAEAPGTYVLR
jgi:polyhydroxyalkanoate synthase